MINLARTVMSPYISAQSFLVYRSQGYFGQGGWIEIPQSPPYFTMWGVVVPENVRDVQMTPQGDRIVGQVDFYTKEEIFVTRNGTYKGISDKILWRGELHRILNVKQFVDYGFFNATGQRIVGD